MRTLPESRFLAIQKQKAFDRVINSASKYVLMRKFNSASRAGLREYIGEGKIEIIDTVFGKAYALVKEDKDV